MNPTSSQATTILPLTFWSSEPEKQGLLMLNLPEKKVEIRSSALKNKMDHLEHFWRENALHVELRLHLQETITLYEQLDGFQLEFEEELEAEDAEIESDIWAGLRNRFQSLRLHVELSITAKEPMDSVGHEGRFREFWDQFEASVHQQTDFSDAPKMAYLRGCLTDVALDALQGLSAANQGYEIAVQRLKGRFDRPQVAVRQHILRSFHTLSKSSDLSAICDECHREMYSLTALGKDSRNGGLSAAEVMIAFALARLPNSVRVQWGKLTMENGSLVADLPGFLRFLQEQVELADTTGGGRETQKTVAFLHSAVEPLCGFCQKQHTIADDRRRKSPSSKDNSAIIPVGATTTERECRRHPWLSTIKARAFGDAGSGITVTCLLDTGEEYSFIREDVASALGVVRRAQPVKFPGGAALLGRLEGSQNAERYPLEALTVPSLCHQIPVSKILTSEWEHLQFLNLILNDESSDEVHVVIGIDYYYRFLGDAIRRGKPGDPVAVETVLGWIICGSVNPHPATKTVAAISAVVEPKVKDLLRRFWEIEGMGIPFRSESDEVELQWRVWKLELNELHCTAIRRAYLPFSPTEASRLELHGFGDASEAAVAPLKKLSTPQLELMAALLCARLVCYVRKELALDVEACHRWSDNKVTVSPPQDAANVMNPGRYSSFERLIRVTAWCRRFRHNTTMPACSRRTGIGLTSDELKEAERIWIRQEQIHAFGSMESLDTAMTKMLCGLNPFLDEFGDLRVGGRLGRAQSEEETKFPALLHRKGMIVDLLITREHNRHAVERVLRTCWICRRVAARPFRQRMGDLPAARVNPARPFSNVGIDFVGPLLIRSKSSKYVSKKAYIFLFTCMVVRAIHLELVPDQTIERFLRAWRRFVTRRGSSCPLGQIVELLTGVTGWQGLHRSRPRQAPCADRSARWSCWNQPKLINGLHPLRGKSVGNYSTMNLVACT
ncbi:hypothetical protein T06_1513 [Trichinella sp. T6]|nr:hypothetical protein T06_1513 [Trichinella sp. T6]